MRHIACGLRIWLCTMVVMCPLVAAAQQATGAIGGTVQDTSGAVMPGVIITLSNPGVIGGNQTAVSSERGTYQFVRLVPGTYSVRAELQGFTTTQRDAIVVNADATARVDLTIEVGTVQETVTVAGASPLLDTTTIQNQTVMDRKTMDAIPTGNSLWSIAALVPSMQISRIDVGGVEAFQESTPKIHGSIRDENRWLIDGMDVSYGGGAGASVSYYDTMSMEEVNYQTGQSPAENQQGGVVMNMITRTGTNRFRFTFDASGSNESLMSENISPEQMANLRAGIPPSIASKYPDIEPSNAVPWIYDTAGSLTGPILLDKLWFVATFRRHASNQIQTGTYNSDGTLATEDNLLNNWQANVGWQVNRNNQIKGTFIRNWTWRFHRRDFPAAVFVENRATTIQDMPMKIFQLKWSSVLSSKMMFDVSGSTQWGPYKRGPQPEVNVQGDLPRLDLVTQIGAVANPFYADVNQSNRGLYASFSYFAGVHNLKFGYQAARYAAQNIQYSTSHFPSGLLARYRNGVPDSVVVYNTPFDTQPLAVSHSVYAQDRWTPTRKLTLNLGLRLQHIRGWIPAVCQPETIFISGRCYDRIDNVPNWYDLSPRFGLVYDIFGDGRTALKVGLNRYFIGTAGGYGNRVNPVVSATETRPWSDTNGDLVPQLTELGAGTGFNVGTTNRYADDVRNPYQDEFTAEVERQLFADLMVSVGYYRRALRNAIGSRNQAVPTSGYIPLTVTEVVSGRQVTVYNQDPATRGKFDVVFDNDSAMNNDFHGVDVNFRKRMSNRWMMLGGFAYGKTTGDTYYANLADLNNPNFTFRNGVLETDVPITLKLSGLYEAPLGLRVSGSYEHYTGYPESTTVQVTAATVALTQVTQVLRVDPQGTVRLPDNDVVNMRVSRAFQVGSGRITPSLDIFNLTNSNTIQAWAQQLGPTYHRITGLNVGGGGILRPRMFRFGVNMTF